MRFLRLVKAVVPTKYEAPAFNVDVRGLIASGLQRYICLMEKSEVRRHVIRSAQDVTGLVVIIGGIGVVDGLDALSSRKGTRIPVSIFEFRNAQYYIQTPLDKFEKNKHGMFVRDSIYGRLMGLPDAKVFDGKDSG